MRCVGALCSEAMEPPAALLETARLELRPITREQALAILEGKRREEIEKLVGAEMPWAWPTSMLVEQVFRASIEGVRKDPDLRLWGDRFIVVRSAAPRVVGSVIFHGRPGPDGVCEMGYGIEETSQNRGYATEALAACVKWALAQPECKVIRCETSAWHKPSLRVLEKVGFVATGSRETEDGKMLVYEIAK